jgi:tetratricopeptide (TPR) repeat protein
LSLALILQRAQTHVQRGQIDAALKLYKGLLVTVPHHPQLNSDLGMLYLQHRTAQEAIKPLEKAASALPKAKKVWICLLVAHYRCGNHKRVKELLAIMRQSGFDEQEFHKIEHDLNQPPPDRIAAVRKLIDKQDVVSAEIAARLLVQDFPDHAGAGLLLQEVLVVNGVKA